MNAFLTWCKIKNLEYFFLRHTLTEISSERPLGSKHMYTEQSNGETFYVIFF